MDARGRHSQLEIGPRLAQPQAIRILRAAVALGVAQTHVIDAILRQSEADQGVSVVRSQVVELVFMVVVEGQTFVGGVEQLQDTVQRRFQPAGRNLSHDLLAGAAFETEHVPVVGPVDLPVDDHGQRDRLGSGRRIIGFRVEAFRQRVHGKRHRVGDHLPLAHRKRVEPRRHIPSVDRQRVGRQVPAGESSPWQ